MTLTVENETATPSTTSAAPVSTDDSKAAASPEAIEYHRHRDQTHLPNNVGMAALVLAFVALIMSFLVMIGTLDWYLPLLATGASIATAIWALTRRHYRKMAAVVALLLAAVSLIAPLSAYTLAGSVTPTGTGAGTRDGSGNPATPLDSLIRVITGDNGAKGASGTSGTAGENGTDGTNGTNGTNGSNGNGTTTTTTGGGLIDVNVGTGGTGTTGTGTTGTGTTGGPLVDVTVPAIVPVLTGTVGGLLTTPTGVSASVTGVTCGLPLVNALGIKISLLGQMCAVSLSVTNNSDHLITLDSSSVTGVSGSTSVLADATLGSNPLSAHVAVGSTATGTVYVKLANASSVLNALKINLGGEPASSLLTVTVH